MSQHNKKKFSLSFSRYQWWRLTAIVMFGLMLSAFLGTSFFLYNYIFRKLEDAHTIVLLNSDAPIDIINMNNYQKAVSYINLKNSSTPFVFPIRNIFTFVEQPSTTSSTPAIVTTTKK